MVSHLSSLSWRVLCFIIKCVTLMEDLLFAECCQHGRILVAQNCQSLLCLLFFVVVVVTRFKGLKPTAALLSRGISHTEGSWRTGQSWQGKKRLRSVVWARTKPPPPEWVSPLRLAALKPIYCFYRVLSSRYIFKRPQLFFFWCRYTCLCIFRQILQSCFQHRLSSFHVRYLHAFCMFPVSFQAINLPTLSSSSRLKCL